MNISFGKSPAWLIFAAALIFASVLFFHRLDTGGDNLDYMMTARSAMHGDMAGLMGWHRPPGYPVFIASLLAATGQRLEEGVLRIAPSTLYLVKCANVLFFALAALVSFLWLKRCASSHAVAVAAAWMLAVNQTWASMASIIWAETLFLFMSVLALWAWERYAAEANARRDAMLLLAATLAAMLAKYQGLALGVAVLAALVLGRRAPYRPVVIAGVLACILAIAALIHAGSSYTLAHLAASDPYGEGHALGMADKIRLWFLTYTTSWADLLMPKVLGDHGLLDLAGAGAAGGLVVAAICLVIATGFLATTMSRGLTLPHLYLMSAMCMLLAWPDYLERYLLPLAPVGYLFFVEGLWLLTRRAKVPAFAAVVAMLVAWSIATNAFAGIKNVRHIVDLRGTPPWNPERYVIAREESFADYIAAGQWIGSNSPPDAVIYCRKAAFVELASQRGCYYYSAFATPGDLWTSVESSASSRPCYILQDTFSPNSTYGRTRMRVLMPALAAHPDRVENVQTTGGGSVILRVSKPASTAATP